MQKEKPNPTAPAFLPTMSKPRRPFRAKFERRVPSAASCFKFCWRQRAPIVADCLDFGRGMEGAPPGLRDAAVHRRGQGHGMLTGAEGRVRRDPKQGERKRESQSQVQATSER